MGLADESRLQSRLRGQKRSPHENSGMPARVGCQTSTTPTGFLAFGFVAAKRRTSPATVMACPTAQGRERTRGEGRISRSNIAVG